MGPQVSSGPTHEVVHEAAKNSLVERQLRGSLPQSCQREEDLFSRWPGVGIPVFSTTQEQETIKKPEKQEAEDKHMAKLLALNKALYRDMSHHTITVSLFLQY